MWQVTVLQLYEWQIGDKESGTGGGGETVAGVRFSVCARTKENDLP